jgi:hypothetical protein
MTTNQGETQPKQPTFRFRHNSEIWHGRLAMLGLAALAVELVTGNGILHLCGLV